MSSTSSLRFSALHNLANPASFPIPINISFVAVLNLSYGEIFGWEFPVALPGFPLKKKFALKYFLESKGVGTSIHYPVPIHLQPAASQLNVGMGSFPVAEDQAKKILTLPVNQFVSEQEIKMIAEQVNSFFVEHGHG